MQVLYERRCESIHANKMLKNTILVTQQLFIITVLAAMKQLVDPLFVKGVA